MSNKKLFNNYMNLKKNFYLGKNNIFILTVFPMFLIFIMCLVDPRVGVICFFLTIIYDSITNNRLFEMAKMGINQKDLEEK